MLREVENTGNFQEETLIEIIMESGIVGTHPRTVHLKTIPLKILIILHNEEQEARLSLRAMDNDVYFNILSLF